jgi:hypothetical protein
MQARRNAACSTAQSGDSVRPETKKPEAFGASGSF